MIEILMFTTIICLVVGTIARYRINESSKKIKELEEKLDRCYMEREQRLRDRGLITSPQDTPAICEYSGLRPVEGYREMSDKELKERVYKSIIDELDNREGETPEEKAYRMGWINGYEEGVYDGENK